MRKLPFSTSDRRTLLAGVASIALLPTGCSEGKPDEATPNLPDLDGRIIPANAPDFEAWRQGLVWQARKPGRAPDMIARVNSADAAAQAIRYARKAGIKVAIKSSGHHVWANFMRDSGMLLDLWPLRGVTLNQDNTAWIEPSAWSQRIMDELGKQGRSFPAAHCASVGMGGFLLGGGVGHNWENWGGLSAYSVLGAEVVLADGSIRQISDNSDPDLMWALRGAGNGFPAVVTRFKVKTYVAPKVTRQGGYFFALNQLPDAMAWCERLVRTGKLKHCEPLVILAHNPMAPPGAKGADAKVCILFFNIFAPDAQSADEVLRYIEEAPSKPTPLMATPNIPWDIQDSFYTTLDFRNALNFGHFGVDNIWTNETQAVLPVLSEHFAKASSPASHVVMSLTSGPRQPANASARIHGKVYMGIYSVGSDAARGDEAIGWLRETSMALRPFACGRYINEIDVANTPNAPQACFTPQDWQRLEAVRRRYDPEGVFQTFMTAKTV